jgi:hypothetical protein
MAGHVTSGSSSVVTGQTVNAQLTLDLAPPIAWGSDVDEFTVDGTNYNKDTQQFLRVVSVTPSASVYLSHRAGSAASNAFNFLYNVHPTQQLFTANNGTRFYIQFCDYLTYGTDVILLQIEWGYEPATGKGILEVYDAVGLQGRIEITGGYIPSGKQIGVQSLLGGWSVFYDGASTAFANGFWNDVITPEFPLRIKYGAYKLSGQTQSITWPAGHPAQSAGYIGWIFSEATLQNTWKPIEPTWTLQALNASGVQIGSNYNPTAITYSSDIPQASFVVPTVAGIDKIRIRAQMHSLNSSALGLATLDIPVGSGGSTPLAVSGANPVTLNPGQTYTVTANYPTSELTFSAVGGGSFGTGATANVYTAPTDYGTSATYQFTVTRTATSEVVSVGVNVPLRITPDIVSMVGGTTQVFTTNGDITTWSTSNGTLSGSAARSRTYTAPAVVGTHSVTATNAASVSATASVTVTSTGATPTTGLRLDPSAGLSVTLNTQAQVRLIGDLSPALWATAQNYFIDFATGNVKITSNTTNGEAMLAQAIDTAAGAADSAIEWQMNATNAQTSGDLGVYGWKLTSSTGAFVGSFRLAYSGSGNSWNAIVDSHSTQIAFYTFTRTDTTGIRLEYNATTHVINARFRADSGAAFASLGSWTAEPNLPKFVSATFTPSVVSKSNGSIVINKPTLTGFGRWVQPNWQASRVDAGGNILGSYPVTPSEESTVVSGNAAQIATVNCNAVGTARVRATYPSGIAAQNDVYITITSSTTALDVTAPAAGTTTNLAPGQTLTITANDDPSALTYSCPGGTFGTGASKNVFTAGVSAGNFTLTVTRGSEVVTRAIKVLMQVTPATQTIPVGSSVTLYVNTTTSFSYSATGGTVSILTVSGGQTLLTYTAPSTAGTYTVNITSSINNASATVTAQVTGTVPITITNTEPIAVEPNGILVVNTNYPTSEVTFTCSGGVFGTRFPKNYWEVPAQAGNYTITVTHPTGGTDSTVAKVYLRIIPKNPAGVAPGAQIQFTANYPLAQTTFFISSASGGTITTQGLWTAGNVGGSYTVTAQATIDSVINEDWSTVTIQGEGLALNVPSAVTLQPGATLTITANKPTGELTFAATGGTFAANVYTAPANAGTYTITVSWSGLNQYVVVTVPVTISPASVSMPQSTTQVFTVNSDVTNYATTGWAATGGTLSAQAIRTVTYTSGTTVGNYTVTAITAGGTVVAAVTNTGVASVPIVITGPAAVTLEPNGTYLVEVNKAVGTYSLTATGGTFEGNQYRAPNQAGTYTVTATDTSGTGGGTDTLTVTVPLRVTPSNSTVLPGVGQQFSANVPPNEVTWSVSGGPGGIGQGAGFISVTGHWSGTVTPGTYTITATTATTSASTTITVQTLELVIYGPSAITLEPDSEYTVLTNYTSRNLVYTAFGGSFSQNVYTAPHQAGAYYFTVSVAGQTKRVDVTVPLRISPKQVNLEAGASQQFTINAASASWSIVGSGTISQTGFYTAPASGGTIARITATTPNGSDTAIVLLLAEFPYQPSYAVAGEIGRNAVIVESEDGTRYGRVKGPTRKAYELRFNNRQQAEQLAAMTFHTARYPSGPFIFHDIKLDMFVAVLFDSKMRWENTGNCQFSYSFRLIEL